MKNVPVTPHQQHEMSSYYDWPILWPDTVLIPGHPQARQHEEENAGEGNLHLINTVEMTGYHVRNSEAEMGRIEDFILDDRDWAVRFIIVDTHDILPGNNTLFPPERVENINRSTKQVAVDFRKEDLKASPEYRMLGDLK